jgi:tetratricopeptide (TPR) repeat protein
MRFRTVAFWFALAVLVSATAAEAPGAETAASAATAADASALPAMPGSLRARLAASPQRAALLAQAESELAAGSIEQARDLFEQAAAMQHAADIEIGILRTQMQAGEYRRALAFAAHTAVAHPEVGAGAVLYAWLLHLGGQDAFARQTLERARTRLPGDAGLQRAADRIAAGMTGGGDSQAAPIDRLAPYAVGAVLPPQARVVGGALLLGDGRRAIAPLASLAADAAQAPIWLRDGLGHTVRAEIAASDPGNGLALLRLATPLAEPPGWALAPREAFPGSPGFAIGFARGDSADPAWPRLDIGFIGMPLPGSEQRSLGIAVPVGSSGAPVVDNAGRLVGIALPPEADGRARLGGVVAIAALAGLALPPGSASASPLPVDELYERGLRTALQLITAR